MRDWRGYAAGLELPPVGDDFPEEVWQSLKASGALATHADIKEFGEVNRRLGGRAGALRTLVTVHAMALTALQRRGCERLQTERLPDFIRGRRLAAFAASERGAGSDLNQVACRAVPDTGGYRLSGEKLWVSFAQVADAFLVLARAPGGLTTFWVDRALSGVEVDPLDDLVGLSESKAGTLRLQDCHLPEDCRLGGEGFGLDLVLQECLTLGRLGVAWGCLGGLEACLEASREHLRDSVLKTNGQVKAGLGRMRIDREALLSTLLRAGQSWTRREPESAAQAMVAKYLGADAYRRAADLAVTLQGAVGCLLSNPLQRHLRDSKVMEIIEGSQPVLAAYLGGELL